jgi:phage terminase large subunit
VRNIAIAVKLRGYPYPKQIQFFKSQARYLAYGGSRGGGKSWAARRKAILLAFRYPGIQILFVRRTYKDLKENHLLQLQAEIGHVCKYDRESHAFIFPNGSRLRLGYCDSEKDAIQYQGQAYDVIFLEEATQFTEFQFHIFTECNRSSGAMRIKFRPRMYLTCNPGGVGHAWVKRLFIDKIYKGKERPENYAFIPSSVYENDYLMENDPDYVEALEALPEVRRKAMLYGDWNVFEGQFFTEWRDNPEGYFTHCGSHVIEPFKIPDTWYRYRSFDFGYAKPFAVGWYAVNHDGVMYKYRELYGCTGEPDVGVRWEPEKIAQEIRKIEDALEPRGVFIQGVADPAIWNKESGESIAEIMERHRVYFDKADNDRLNGWMQMHNRLEFDDEGKAALYIFKTCPNTIRTLPLMLHDKVKVEDLDTKLEDHIADEMRYICMARPIGPRKRAKPKAVPYNPLETERDTKYDPYGFIRQG